MHGLGHLGGSARRVRCGLGWREAVSTAASAGARRYRLEDRGADGPRAPWRRSRRRDQAGDPKSLSISSEWWSSRSATLRLDQPPDVTGIVVPAVRGASSRLLGRTGLPPAPPHPRIGELAVDGVSEDVRQRIGRLQGLRSQRPRDERDLLRTCCIGRCSPSTLEGPRSSAGSDSWRSTSAITTAASRLLMADLLTSRTVGRSTCCGLTRPTGSSLP